VSFAAAALNGLAADGGLYVPEALEPYRPAVRSSLGTLDYAELAYETIRPYVCADIDDGALRDIVSDAYNFDAPLVAVGGRFVLELFHGPTAAFKDFGARFMARAFSHLRRGETKPLKILVATSGDTGGAVADGFFGVEGISVTVLYPKGRVSPLQERQIAGLGGNIAAVAVEGSFDDCQALVKAAFGDAPLRKRLTLSSANSINIARLLPQAVYYAYGSGGPRPAGSAAWKTDAVFCVPSGNFGNLTAGLYAKAMGAPIGLFIAATNINKTVPDYLESGVYEARPSKATLSNAMDVGAPSNFERMSAHWSHSELRAMLRGVWVSDEETRATIRAVHEKHGYFLDPHTAVGWCGVDKLSSQLPPDAPVAVLATAHAAKFAPTVEPLAGKVPMPPSLEKAASREARSVTIPNDINALLEVL
jgi:threonine synthase